MKFKAILIFAIIALITNTINSQTNEQEFEFVVKSPESIARSYEWSGATDFGGNVTEDICGELVWGENGEETTGCSPLADDLTNKIALIRRGDCDFSLKVFHAQQAGAKAAIILNHNDSGDPDELVGMLGGDSSSAVTIPSIFISYNTGMTILPFIESNSSVDICLELPTFNLEFGPYSYFTPQSQIVPLDNMSVQVINRTSENLTNVSSFLSITDPSGDITDLVTTNNMDVGEEVRFLFDPYLPEEIGEYSMFYSSGIDGKTIERKFEITEHTWGMDNGNIIGAIGPSETLFANSNFFYQHANLVLAGADGIATHVTFGLGNGADLFTDDPSSDIIIMAIYNADKNGDNVIDAFTDFEGLGDPLEFGIYQITGEETFENLISAPLDSPLSLEAGGIYYVSLAYDGLGAGTGVGPLFTATTDEGYENFPSTPVLLDRLYSGWSGATIVTRLQLEGFISSTKDLEILDAGKLVVKSNPITNGTLEYELILEDYSDKVDIMFRNLEGKLIDHKNFKHYNRLTETIDVSTLPSGTYFLNVNTEEGFKSEKVIVVND